MNAKIRLTLQRKKEIEIHNEKYFRRSSRTKV